VFARTQTFSGGGNEELFLDGTAGSQRILIPLDSTVRFEIAVTAVAIATTVGSVGQSFSQKIRGLIKRIADTVSLVGALDTDTAIKDAGFGGTVAVTADDTNKILRIDVTGETDKTIVWSAKVSMVHAGMTQ
jgi:hypothetical protein